MVNLVSSTKSGDWLCARVDLHEHPDGLDRPINTSTSSVLKVLQAEVRPAT